MERKKTIRFLLDENGCLTAAPALCSTAEAETYEYAEDNASEEIACAVDKIEILYHDGISVSFDGAEGADEIDPTVHPLAALILIADAAREGGE